MLFKVPQIGSFTFQEHKIQSSWAPLQTSLGELTVLPQTSYSCEKARRVRRKEKERTRKEGRVRRGENEREEKGTG